LKKTNKWPSKKTGRTVNSELILENPVNPIDPAVRETLLTKHLSDVRYIAQRIHERLPVQIPIEDLVHAGIIGLIEAVDRFDPGKHTELATFARFRIRGAILDSLRATDWSPRSLRKKGRAVEAANRALSAELGRAPSEVELAERLSMSLAKFQHLLTELNGLNLGSLDSSNDFDSPETQIEDVNRAASQSEDPFSSCLKGELKSLLTEALEALDERERQVVSLYYFEELTMKEVGVALDLGESRVSQIHSLALVRLREKLHKRLSGAEAAELSVA
jgi:RNA polymerase sigma factor for flagellar operon FliA